MSNRLVPVTVKRHAHNQVISWIYVILQRRFITVSSFQARIVTVKLSVHASLAEWVQHIHPGISITANIKYIL